MQLASQRRLEDVRLEWASIGIELDLQICCVRKPYHLLGRTNYDNFGYHTNQDKFLRHRSAPLQRLAKITQCTARALDECIRETEASGQRRGTRIGVSLRVLCALCVESLYRATRKTLIQRGTEKPERGPAWVAGSRTLLQSADPKPYWALHVRKESSKLDCVPASSWKEAIQFVFRSEPRCRLALISRHVLCHRGSMPHEK